MAWRNPFRRAAESRHAQPRSPLPGTAQRLLEGLREAWLVIGPTGRVEASQGVGGLGIVRGGTLVDPELVRQADRTRAGAGPETRDVAIGGVAMGAPPRRVRASTTMLDDGLLLLLLEDISAAARVDAMRRTFIADVAHELRAPVQEMLTSAKDMQRALRKGRSVTQLTDDVENGARRLGALVADITDISRLQVVDAMEGARDATLDEVAGPAVDAVQSQARDKRITIDVHPAQVSLYVNVDQVVTALRNLLMNAITYSEPHTKVTVRAEQVGDQVAIAVEDEGVGIPVEHLERIFERFHRVDPERSRATGGTGLGLPIVRQICEAHGGEVLVASTPGRGSVFTMRLPSRRLGTASSAQAWQEGL